MKTRTWEDKDTQKKMYRTEVVVSEFTFLPGEKDGVSPKDAEHAKEASTTKNKTDELDF